MGAFDELRSGVVGPETVRLLYESVASCARLRRFPAPPGSDRWDRDAVQEVAHDFIDRGGLERLRALAVTATDDRSLERLLDRTIRNHLRDAARATARGRLARAVSYRLGEMDRVRRVGGEGAGALWMLDGADPNGTAPPLEELVASSYRLDELVISRTRVAGGRGSALIDPASLESVLADALAVAACPLDTATLVDVVFARFPSVVEDSAVELDDDRPSPSEADAALEADGVWDQLELPERLVLPAAAGSSTVREVAEDTGLSRSSAQRAVVRAKTILEAALRGTNDPEGVARELLERAAQLVSGTGTSGSSSSSSAGGPA